MTFRWDPSGSARLAFNAEMEAVNSRWENPFQQNLNQNLIQLQQWALEEELGSSLFFRAVELIQTMKPEELEFDDTPELYTLLVLVLLLEKEEQDGRICVSQSEILDSLNEALEAGIITKEEFENVVAMEKLRDEVVAVDSFDLNELPVQLPDPTKVSREEPVAS